MLWPFCTHYHIGEILQGRWIEWSPLLVGEGVRVRGLVTVNIGKRPHDGCVRKEKKMGKSNGEGKKTRQTAYERKESEMHHIYGLFPNIYKWFTKTIGDHIGNYRKGN